MLKNWKDHFSKLSESRLSSDFSANTIPSLFEMEATTYQEIDHALDSSFEVEEVESAICHLKKNSSGGHDHLSPSHLLYSGPLFKNWICQVFNSILSLEDIPSTFKEGIILPIYKGKGKDPLLYKAATEVLLLHLFYQKRLSLFFLIEFFR